LTGLVGTNARIDKTEAEMKAKDEKIEALESNVNKLLQQSMKLEEAGDTEGAAAATAAARAEVTEAVANAENQQDKENLEEYARSWFRKMGSLGTMTSNWYQSARNLVSSKGMGGTATVQEVRDAIDIAEAGDRPPVEQGVKNFPDEYKVNADGVRLPGNME